MLKSHLQLTGGHVYQVQPKNRTCIYSTVMGLCNNKFPAHCGSLNTPNQSPHKDSRQSSNSKFIKRIINARRQRGPPSMKPLPYSQPEEPMTLIESDCDRPVEETSLVQPAAPPSSIIKVRRGTKKAAKVAAKAAAVPLPVQVPVDHENSQSAVSKKSL